MHTNSFKYMCNNSTFFYLSASQFSARMILQILGSPLLGFLMAKFVMFWLSHIFNDGLIEITISLATAYITFYVGKKRTYMYWCWIDDGEDCCSGS